MPDATKSDPPPPDRRTVDDPLRLTIDYPDRPLDRVSTLLRIVWIIPIGVVLASIGGQEVAGSPLLTVPIILMIVFRRKYPRWWFDFGVELARFETRIFSYLALMSDRYPSTDDPQYVHLDVDYPDVERDLNRWLPLVKWLLAIPHYVVLVLLGVGAVGAVVIAWFSVLFTGRYPRPLFDFVEGVFRWVLRVQAYAFLLVTDRYPPFRLG
ncbi:MAG: DUF4389 domain-containing protein [Ilumatobacter sp.]|uniref:DUF4389 domain-containing protein n=1 Tax=Ilumatobacter sp. TaxID=1967498 RepID=UPI00329A08E4